MRTQRVGYVLIEGLVVLTLSLLVGALVCASLVTQSRLARVVGDRIAHNDATRATLQILGAELRMADPTDFRDIANDSIAARWIRASGAVCLVQGRTAWLRLRAIRAPDDTKDSALVINSAGEQAFVVANLTRDQSMCAPTGMDQVYRWTSAPAAATRGAVVFIFESGSYYLSQRALRYRLGAEGRQPLTEEFFRDGASAFVLMQGDTTPCSGIRITLALRPGTGQTIGQTAQAAVLLPNGRSCP